MRALLLVVCLLIGCSRLVLVYRPEVPRKAQAASISAELLHVGVTPTLDGPLTHATVELRISAAKTVALLGATLADQASTPCGGGLPAESIGLTPYQPLALPIAVEPAKSVFVLFHRDEKDGGLPIPPSVVDVRLLFEGAPSCVRLSFTSATSRWRPITDRSTMPVYSALFPVGADPALGGSTVYAIQFGVWSGRRRFWLEPGAMTAATNGGRYLRPYVGAHAEYVFSLHGSSAYSASAGYVVATAHTPDLRLIHGPQLALRYKLVLPELLGTSGFPGGPEFTALEVAVPIQFWFGLGPVARPLGLTLGLSFAFNP